MTMQAAVAAVDEYTFRFTTFAREHGEEPKAWLDSRRDDDGVVSMLPFSLWISARWAEFRVHLSKLPREARRPFDTTNQAMFDEWLCARTKT